jgi:hypothetical protein
MLIRRQLDGKVYLVHAESNGVYLVRHPAEADGLLPVKARYADVVPDDTPVDYS